MKNELDLGTSLDQVTKWLPETSALDGVDSWSIAVDDFRKPEPLKASPKAKRVRIAVRCNECGRKFSVGPNSGSPQCRNCNSVDIDVL